MNTLQPFPTQIIGLDTSRTPVLLLVTSPCEQKPGAVVPEEYQAFESLQDFIDYWDRHWRNSGVRVAIPDSVVDPLRVGVWLHTIGQPLEAYDWFDCHFHLHGDMTLANIGIQDDFRAPYTLALYACYRLNAASVARSLWVTLFELCSRLDETRHSIHCLAASLQEPAYSTVDVPF